MSNLVSRARQLALCRDRGVSESRRPRTKLATVLRNLIVLPADTVRLVQEVLTIAEGAFCILVDREHDRLHMAEAVAFTRAQVSYIGERLNPGRVVRIESYQFIG